MALPDIFPMRGIIASTKDTKGSSVPNRRSHGAERLSMVSERKGLCC